MSSWAVKKMRTVKSRPPAVRRVQSHTKENLMEGSLLKSVAKWRESNFSSSSEQEIEDQLICQVADQWHNRYILLQLITILREEVLGFKLKFKNQQTFSDELELEKENMTIRHEQELEGLKAFAAKEREFMQEERAKEEERSRLALSEGNILHQKEIQALKDSAARVLEDMRREKSADVEKKRVELFESNIRHKKEFRCLNDSVESKIESVKREMAADAERNIVAAVESTIDQYKKLILALTKSAEEEKELLERERVADAERNREALNEISIRHSKEIEALNNFVAKDKETMQRERAVDTERYIIALSESSIRHNKEMEALKDYAAKEKEIMQRDRAADAERYMLEVSEVSKKVDHLCEGNEKITEMVNRELDLIYPVILPYDDNDQFSSSSFSDDDSKSDSICPTVFNSGGNDQFHPLSFSDDDSCDCDDQFRSFIILSDNESDGHDIPAVLSNEEQKAAKDAAERIVIDAEKRIAALGERHREVERYRSALAALKLECKKQIDILEELKYFNRR